MDEVQAESVSLEFDNVCVSVKPRFKNEKQILFNVSGTFPRGKLIGILGPSGAGKSTLLNVLSGFDRSHHTGTILIDGAPRQMATFRKISSYITQDDDLHALLTALENMRYAADLKLGTDVDDLQKFIAHCI